MSAIGFDFRGTHWSMEAACGTNVMESVNPAPTTHPCIYIIHNQNTNQTYVGYAKDANDRWKTRYESFHCFGIDSIYAKNVLCAACIPEENSTGAWKAISGKIDGSNAAEHLLIRAVVNGVLGMTTSTNSMMGKVGYNYPGVDEVLIYLPKNKWGYLEGQKSGKVGNFY